MSWQTPKRIRDEVDMTAVVEVVDLTQPEGIFGSDPKLFTLPNWMEMEKKPRRCLDSASYERPLKRGRKGEDQEIPWNWMADAEATNLKPVGPESPSYSPSPEIRWNWMADAGAPVKKGR
jgi:hypothetical protein